MYAREGCFLCEIEDCVGGGCWGVLVGVTTGVGCCGDNNMGGKSVVIRTIK